MTATTWQSLPVRKTVKKISTVDKKIKQKEALSAGRFPVIDQGQDFIAGYYNEPSKVIDAGPVIVFGDHTKAIKFVDFPFVPGADGTKVLQPNPELFIPKLFYYFLHCIKFPDKGYARHYQHLEKELINIPPVADQEKIVAKIEELFSELEVGITSIETAGSMLASYQQSLLHGLFKRKDMVTLGSLLEEVRYGTSKKCNLDKTLTPVLRIPNIVNGFIDPTELKYASFDEAEKKKLSLKVGDLLVIRSNGSPSIVGKCADIREIDQGYLFAGYLIRLRFDPSQHSSKFYKYLLSSPQLREQIEFKAKSTSGVNNINAEELKSLIVPKLPLSEQLKVVRILDEKSTEVESVKRAINASMINLKALKQSILSKAFKGELV